MVSPHGDIEGIKEAYSMRSRVNCRDLILDAAEKIAINEGIVNLTLDSVAKLSGVSKGGLLYHFPSKERLIDAMMERLDTRMTNEFNALRLQYPDTSDRDARIYVQQALSNPRPERLVASILVVAASSPGKVEFLKRIMASRMSKIANVSAQAKVACLAADSLWLFEFLGLSTYSEEQRQELVGEIMRMTGATTPGKKPTTKK